MKRINEKEYNLCNDYKDLLNIKKIKILKDKGVEYLDLIISFDIETSNTKIDNKKVSFMYTWQIGVENNYYIGRTWEEFESFITYMTNKLKLNKDRRVLIYVHNLGFELTFLLKRFNFINVFQKDVNVPIYAITDNGIEFRCSYMLSNASLKTLASDFLINHDIKKLELDYEKIRHNNTLLKNEEISYILNDVIIVSCYIEEQIQIYKKITKIPLTNTQKVKKEVKKKCLPHDNKIEYYSYKNSVNGYSNSINYNAKEYKFLKKAFMGGFTHGAIKKNNKIYGDVKSYDIISSYPSLIKKPFPMGKGSYFTHAKKEDIEKLKKSYFFVMTIYLKNVRLKKDAYECPLSLSKCITNLSTTVTHNGRVEISDALRVTLTDLDLEIVDLYYDYDEIEIIEGYSYRKGYLPKSFIKCVLDFYNNKTIYKGDDSNKNKYLLSKILLNSLFGMCVQDITHDSIEYDKNEGWTKAITTEESIENELKKYNEKDRLTNYVWGVFWTAHARHDLLEIIYKMGENYIYSDTDSIKFAKSDLCDSFINDFNDKNIKDLEKMCDSYNIDKDLIKPFTKYGEIKPLGIFEKEYDFEFFKYLEAKRYIGFYYDKNKENYALVVTCSGVNKEGIYEYLIEESMKILKYDKNDFNDKEKRKNIFLQCMLLFDYGLNVPAEKSKKTCAYYSNDGFEALVKDYNGEELFVKEDSYVYVETSDFTLKTPEEKAIDSLVLLLTNKDLAEDNIL